MYKCLLKNCAAKSSFFIFILLSLSTPSFSYDFAGGTGEPNNPYRIATAEQLLQIGSDPNLLNKCYILLNDIDLDPNVTGIPPFTRAPIAPDINNSEYEFQGIAFTGSFDGNGKKIMNMKISNTGAGNVYLGLFGWIDSSVAQVKNLGLENTVITGGIHSWSLGGLCGHNHYGTISNCYVTGSISGYRALGGLCGENDNGIVINCWATSSVSGGENLGGLCGENFNRGIINNCYSSGQVIGRDYSDFLGGLCGYNSRGTISNCYSSGQVIGGTGSGALGGLCGWNDSTINKCFASGSITGGLGSGVLGGLCGENFNGTISNCYSSGSVSGDDILGGLCGLNDGKIINCYTAGSVSGEQNKGGFCGYNDNGSFTGCFWDTQASGMNDGVGNMEPDPISVKGKTTEQMKTLSTFIGWDFTDIWAICEGTNYPRMQWQIPQADLLCPDGVDFLDFAFFANYWLNSDCAAINNCSRTDFDLSSIVDSNDLNILTSHWLQN